MKREFQRANDSGSLALLVMSNGPGRCGLNKIGIVSRRRRNFLRYQEAGIGLISPVPCRAGPYGQLGWHRGLTSRPLLFYKR